MIMRQTLIGILILFMSQFSLYSQGDSLRPYVRTSDGVIQYCKANGSLMITTEDRNRIRKKDLNIVSELMTRNPFGGGIYSQGVRISLTSIPKVTLTENERNALFDSDSLIVDAENVELAPYGSLYYVLFTDSINYIVTTSPSIDYRDNRLSLSKCYLFTDSLTYDLMYDQHIRLAMKLFKDYDDVVFILKKIHDVSFDYIKDSEYLKMRNLYFSKYYIEL